MVRVWLVERTFSDDELNIVILVYATTDGERYLRQERALTTFSAAPDVTAAIDVPADRLAPVDDPDERERYAREATRVAAARDPDDVI